MCWLCNFRSVQFAEEMAEGKVTGKGSDAADGQVTRTADDRANGAERIIDGENAASRKKGPSEG